MPTRMPTRRRWSLALVGATVLGLMGVGAWLLVRGPAVSVVQPSQGEVRETVVSSGRVLAPAEINIAALVSTGVREVHVEEGDSVHVGQLLILLDDAEMVAAVAEAEAALERARAGRFELTTLSEPAARANLSKAAATLAEAKRNLEQSKQLYESSYGTLAEYESAQTALALASAQHSAAKLQLAATKSGGSQALLTSAGVAVATAQLERAKAQLARTRIESPVDGIVLARNLEPGDSVTPGTRMLRLSRSGLTRLVIEPDERNLARLAVGQSASASAEAFPELAFPAIVQYLAPSVDPERGTIEVHLSVPDAPAYLRPHMTVSVEVLISTHEDTMLIPRPSLRGLASASPFVFVVEAGRVAARSLEVGIRGDQHVEVLEGLELDDWIIADESVAVEPGQRVRAREHDQE